MSASFNPAALFNKSSKQNQQPSPSKPQGEQTQNNPSQTNQQIPPKQNQNSNQLKANPFATKKTPQSQPSNDIFTKPPSQNIFGNKPNQNMIFQNKPNESKSLFGNTQQKSNLFDKKINEDPFSKNKQTLFTDQSNKGNLFQNLQSNKGNIFGLSNNQSNQFIKSQASNIFQSKPNDTQKQSFSNQSQPSNKGFSLTGGDLKDKNVSSNDQTVKPPPLFGTTNQSGSLFGANQGGNLFGTPNQGASLFGAANQSTSLPLFTKKDQTSKPNIFGAVQSKAPNPIFSLSKTPTQNIFSTQKQDQKTSGSNTNQQKKVNNTQQTPLQSSNFFKKEIKVFSNLSQQLNQKEQSQIKGKQVMNILNDNNNKNTINQKDPSTNKPQQQTIPLTQTQKKLQQKKQQIFSLLRKIQQNQSKLQLQSKLTLMKTIHQQQRTQWQENISKQNTQLQERKKQLKKQFQEINEQVNNLQQQNLSKNNFGQILLGLINQSGQQSNRLLNILDNDQYQQKLQSSIDEQMTCLVQKLNSFYHGGDSAGDKNSSTNNNLNKVNSDSQQNSNNPQQQIKSIYKSILDQQNKYQSFNNENVTVNKFSAQKLKAIQYLKKNASYRLIKRKNRSNNSSVVIGNQNNQHQHQHQQQIPNISQLQNNHQQQQAQDLSQLKRQNRKKMRDMLLKRQQIKQQKQHSKISQGKTSIIMESIIMVGEK